MSRYGCTQAVALASAVVATLVGSDPASGQTGVSAAGPLPERPRPWPSVRGPLDLGPGSDLDSFILAKMEQARLPSVAACVIHDDTIIWSGAYGVASIDPEIPATVDTLYLIASNSKPVSTTALMTLYDQGVFGLDDPVNDYLPFSVRHPNHGDTPITPRMLLSHTAAIDDDWAGSLLGLVSQGDSPVPLHEFLPAYLVPGGAYYSTSGCFLLGQEPGEAFHYTNVGFTLGAYLAAPLSGRTFIDHCQQSLFDPLGMDETSWLLEGLDIDHVAMPYQYDEERGVYVAEGHTGWPAYPSACLRTSVLQQARVLMVQMNDGRSDGVPVLRPLTTAQMQVSQVPPSAGLEYGLGLYRLTGLDNQPWIGHDGYWWGNRTLMYFRPADNVGIVLFTNGDPIINNQDLAFYEIFFRLAEEFDQTCAADTDDDGRVGVSDLLDLLAAWGPCASCREDLDHDGDVDFGDILLLLGAWGRCPYVTATGPLGPVGAGVAPTTTLRALPRADGDVALSFEAIADLGDPAEQIEVRLNGAVVATVFGDDARDCPETPDTTRVDLSADTFNALVTGGTAVLELRGTADVDPRQCDGFSYVDVRLQYEPGATPGACCFDDGTCATTDESDCVEAGGLYRGDGSTCAADCSTGSCCLTSGCVDVILEFCEAMGGIHGGFGSSCADGCQRDRCADAIVVIEGSHPFSTGGATEEGPDLPGACDEGGGLLFRKDVWYRYEASCDGTATASVCDSTFDTRLAIYEDGDCPGAFLACNDNACGDAGTRSEVSFPVQAGATYLVRIGARFAVGEGTLVIDCAE